MKPVGKLGVKPEAVLATQPARHPAALPPLGGDMVDPGNFVDDNSKVLSGEVNKQLPQDRTSRGSLTSLDEAPGVFAPITMDGKDAGRGGEGLIGIGGTKSVDVRRRRRQKSLTKELIPDVTPVKSLFPNPDPDSLLGNGEAQRRASRLSSSSPARSLAALQGTVGTDLPEFSSGVTGTGANLDPLLRTPRNKKIDLISLVGDDELGSATTKFPVESGRLPLRLQRATSLESVSSPATSNTTPSPSLISVPAIGAIPHSTSASASSSINAMNFQASLPASASSNTGLQLGGTSPNGQIDGTVYPPVTNSNASQNRSTLKPKIGVGTSSNSVGLVQANYGQYSNGVSASLSALDVYQAFGVAANTEARNNGTSVGQIEVSRSTTHLFAYDESQCSNIHEIEARTTADRFRNSQGISFQADGLKSSDSTSGSFNVVVKDATKASQNDRILQLKLQEAKALTRRDDGKDNSSGAVMHKFSLWSNKVAAPLSIENAAPPTFANSNVVSLPPTADAKTAVYADMGSYSSLESSSRATPNKFGMASAKISSSSKQDNDIEGDRSRPSRLRGPKAVRELSSQSTPTHSSLGTNSGTSPYSALPNPTADITPERVSVLPRKDAGTLPMPLPNVFDDLENNPRLRPSLPTSNSNSSQRLVNDTSLMGYFDARDENMDWCGPGEVIEIVSENTDEVTEINEEIADGDREYEDEYEDDHDHYISDDEEDYEEDDVEKGVSDRKLLDTARGTTNASGNTRRNGGSSNESSSQIEKISRRKIGGSRAIISGVHQPGLARTLRNKVGNAAMISAGALHSPKGRISKGPNKKSSATSTVTSSIESANSLWSSGSRGKSKHQLKHTSFDMHGGLRREKSESSLDSMDPSNVDVECLTCADMSMQDDDQSIQTVEEDEDLNASASMVSMMMSTFPLSVSTMKSRTPGTIGTEPSFDGSATWDSSQLPTALQVPDEQSPPRPPTVENEREIDAKMAQLSASGSTTGTSKSGARLSSKRGVGSSSSISALTGTDISGTPSKPYTHLSTPTAGRNSSKKAASLGPFTPVRTNGQQHSSRMVTNNSSKATTSSSQGSSIRDDGSGQNERTRKSVTSLKGSVSTSKKDKRTVEKVQTEPFDEGSLYNERLAVTSTSGRTNTASDTATNADPGSPVLSEVSDMEDSRGDFERKMTQRRRGKSDPALGYAGNGTGAHEQESSTLSGAGFGLVGLQFANSKLVSDIGRDPTLLAGAASTNKESFIVTEPAPARSVSSEAYGMEPAPEPIKWKRGEVIGEGTFGKVYKALNEKTGELLAVKQLFLSDGSDAEVHSLRKEIRVISDLDHENIVRYLGTTQSDHYLFILLEYVPGGSIHSMLTQFGAFSEDLVKRFCSQIIAGIEYLHDKNIIHRDIKGANVLVTDSGVAKLSDFGCSKQLVGRCTASLEESLRAIRGSVPWMAPEVIKQSGLTGKASDIWSIGAFMIEMATGKPPWSEFNNNLAALFHVATSQKPPPIPEHLSPMCASFMGRCLAIEPLDRATARELRMDTFLGSAGDIGAKTVGKPPILKLQQGMLPSTTGNPVDSLGQTTTSLVAGPNQSASTSIALASGTNSNSNTPVVMTRKRIAAANIASNLGAPTLSSGTISRVVSGGSEPGSIQAVTQVTELSGNEKRGVSQVRGRIASIASASKEISYEGNA